MKEFVPVRLSHLLRHCAVGAIVRAPQGLLVVQDTRRWTDRQGQAAGSSIPYVERARAALEITQQLREPPLAREIRGGQVDGVCVPATRFPFWMRCPERSCGRLYFKPWKQEGNDPPRCQLCAGKPRLEQVAWVLADPDGYLTDVPWDWMVHESGRDPKKRQCKERSKLRLLDRDLDRRELRCDACMATKQFRGNEQIPFGQGRTQPWVDANEVVPSRTADAKPSDMARVLPVNDTRVHSVQIALALVIPPESRLRKGTAVDRLYRNSHDRAQVDGARNPLARKTVLKQIANHYRCNVLEIEEALTEIERGYPLYGETFTPGQVQESEYQALLEALPDQKSDEDLVTTDQTVDWHRLKDNDKLDRSLFHAIGMIDRLVRADRLKAVEVLKGFRRIDDRTLVPPDLVGQSDWLPALELFGEGIFLKLDEQRLRAWEALPAVIGRVEQMQRRHAQSGRDLPDKVTPRFVLLHTFAHLLIRQIEFEGGYPAASLKERVYCATAPEPMAGILIWVAVADIAGSLGGLSELAAPNRFLGLLSRVLEHANWCSLDPVCSEHEGQGPGLLNRAACHACALIPEPACEFGNTLLDRATVKGSHTEGIPSPFSDASA